MVVPGFEGKYGGTTYTALYRRPIITLYLCYTYIRVVREQCTLQGVPIKTSIAIFSRTERGILDLAMKWNWKWNAIFLNTKYVNVSFCISATEVVSYNLSLWRFMILFEVRFFTLDR